MCGCQFWVSDFDLVILPAFGKRVAIVFERFTRCFFHGDVRFSVAKVYEHLST